MKWKLFQDRLIKDGNYTMPAGPEISKEAWAPVPP